MSGDSGIENEIGYLPKNQRDWLWYIEGMVVGATIVMIIVAALVYLWGK